MMRVLLAAALVCGLTCVPKAPEEGCSKATDCGRGSYCARKVGGCDGSGMCASRPEVCAQIYAPVCSCEDATHSNLCSAASAGASVRHVGICD